MRAHPRMLAPGQLVYPTRDSIPLRRSLASAHISASVPLASTTCRTVDGLTHAAPVQSVAASGSWGVCLPLPLLFPLLTRPRGRALRPVTSVDSEGKVCSARRGDGGAWDAAIPVETRAGGLDEASWHGLATPAVDPGADAGPPAAAVCSSLARRVTLVQGGQVVRRFYTALAPTAVRSPSCPAPHTPAATAHRTAAHGQRPAQIAFPRAELPIVVAEHNHVRVLDPRQGSKGGVAHREPVSHVRQYAAAHRGQDVVLGGEDGVVSLFDIRASRVRARWSAPLKYAVTALAASPTLPDAVYIAGEGQELLCAPTEGVAAPPATLRLDHNVGFRAHAPWVGIAAAPVPEGGLRRAQAPSVSDSEEVVMPTGAAAAAGTGGDGGLAARVGREGDKEVEPEEAASADAAPGSDVLLGVTTDGGIVAVTETGHLLAALRATAQRVMAGRKRPQPAAAADHDL